MARHGLDAHGYDISPAMIEIAREEARRENVEAHFDTADYEQLDLGHAFDACLTYDALHHSPNPERVLATAHRALKPGGAAPRLRAELEAALPGPRRNRRVRHDRARLLTAPPQAPAQGRRLHRDPPLPQQPQAPLRQPPRRRARASRRTADLPAARAVLDADLVARESALMLYRPEDFEPLTEEVVARRARS